MCDSPERAQLLAEVLQQWEQTRALLESVESTRQLRIIRTNMKKVFAMPRGRSDAQKDGNRLAKQRFYARQRETILERKRLRRNERKARELIGSE